MKKQLILATLVMAISTASVLAQPPGGGGGRGGFGGFGGGRGMGAPRDLSLASAPLPALVIGFKLDATQEAAVKVIQDKLTAQRDEAMQAMRAGFQGGGNVDPAERQARMQEMQDKMQQMQQQQQQADATSSREIQKLLTPEQAAMISPTFKLWKRYQDAGLDLGLAVSMKFTPEQEKAIDDFIKNRPAPGQGRGGANGRAGAGGGANGRAGRGGAAGGATPPPPSAH